MASGRETAGKMNSHETNRFTLRFKHSLAEEGFLRAQGTRLYRGAFVVLVPGLLLSLAVLVSVALRNSSAYSNRQRLIDRSQLMVCVALSIFLLFMLAVIGLFARCKLGYRRAGLRFMEFFLVFVFIICLLLVVLTDRFYMTKILFRTNPQEIWRVNFFSDSRILLVFVGIVVVTHLATPIRWFVLVYLDISAVIIYILLCIVVGTSEATLIQFNIPLLGFVILSSSLGRRGSERGERRAFALIAQERVLRVESQFELNSYKTDNARSRDEDVTSSSMYRSSIVPSTADTERLFNATNFPNAVKFDEIERVGLHEGWLIDFSDLEIARTPSNILGQGSFGMVIEGKYNGALVAIKLPKEEEVTEVTEPELRTQFNELRILRHLRHPNIVVFYGAATIRNHTEDQEVEPGPIGYLALVLERLYGMSLDAFVKQNDQRPRCAGMHYTILLGACSALRYLHALTPQVVHGDLKPANIWVTIGNGRPCAKLLDYGLSRALTKRARPLGGSIMWVAPEVFHAAPPSKSSDVFSFGLVMFFVVVGRTPLSSDEVKKLKASHQLPPLQWPVDQEFPTAIKQSIEDCRDFDPRARPSIFEVYDVLMAFCKEEGLAPFSPRLDMPRKRDRGVASGAIPSRRNDRNQKIRSSELERNVLFGESTGELDSVPEEPEGQGCSSSHDRPPPDYPLPLEVSGPKKLYDSFHLTSAHSQKLTVLEAIARWNVMMPRDMCCRLHCAVESLQRVTTELEHSKCSSLVTTYQNLVQCKSCGLLDLDARKRHDGLFHVCEVCAHDDLPDDLDDNFAI